MTEIHYYRATVADVGVMTELRTAFHIEYGGPQDYQQLMLLKSELDHYFRRAIADESYITWLAKTGDKVVACGGMVMREQPGNFRNPSGRSGYVMNMYTVPEFRKMGIGSNIVNRLMETGREKGLHLFELHATKAGAPVYEQCGFDLHNEPTYRKYCQ